MFWPRAATAFTRSVPCSRSGPCSSGSKHLKNERKLSEKQLLLKLGEDRGKYPLAWRLIDSTLPGSKGKKQLPFSFKLNRKKLRQVRRREGRYLLCTNLCGRDPAALWQFYIQFTEVEAAFKNLKDDLSLRPIYHRLEARVEAHIFVAFMAYCLQITMRARLKPFAPGLTARAVIEKMAALQMLDVQPAHQRRAHPDPEPLYSARSR